ncbi:hypothetical protein HDU93_002602, partial [Gonapodya sp. JEL0774]
MQRAVHRMVEAEAAKDDMSRVLQSQEEDAQRLESALLSSQTALSQKQEEVVNLEYRISEMEAHLAEFARQSEYLQEERNHLFSETESLGAILLERNSECDSLFVRVRQAEETIREKDAQVDNVLRTVVAETNRADLLQTEKQDLRSQVSVLESEISDLLLKNVLSRERELHTENEVDRLRGLVDNLRENVSNEQAKLWRYVDLIGIQYCEKCVSTTFGQEVEVDREMILLDDCIQGLERNLELESVIDIKSMLLYNANMTCVAAEQKVERLLSNLAGEQQFRKDVVSFAWRTRNSLRVEIIKSESYHKTLTQGEEALLDAQESITELSRRVAEAETARDHSERQIAELVLLRQDLETKVVVLQAQCDDFRRVMEEMTSAMRIVVETDERNIEELRSEREGYRQSLESLKCQLEQSQNDASHITERLADRESAILSLREYCNTHHRNTKRDEERTLDDDVFLLMSPSEPFSEEVGEDAGVSHFRLQEQCIANDLILATAFVAKEAFEAFSGSQREVRDLRDLVGHFEAEKNVTTRELSDLRTWVEQLSNTLIESESAKAGLQSRMSQLEEDLLFKTSTLDRLNEEIDKRGTRIATTVRDVASLRTEIDMKDEKIRSLEEKAVDLTRGLEEQRESIALLRKALVDKDLSLASQQTALDEEIQQREAQYVLFCRLESESSSLRDQNERLASQLTISETERVRLSEVLDEASQTIALNVSGNQELAQQLVREQEKSKALHSDVLAQNKAIGDLVLKIEDLNMSESSRIKELEHSLEQQRLEQARQEQQLSASHQQLQKISEQAEGLRNRNDQLKADLDSKANFLVELQGVLTDLRKKLVENGLEAEDLRKMLAAGEEHVERLR